MKSKSKTKHLSRVSRLCTQTYSLPRTPRRLSFLTIIFNIKTSILVTGGVAREMSTRFSKTLFVATTFEVPCSAFDLGPSLQDFVLAGTVYDPGKETSG